MDRREFLRQVAGWSAGALLASPLFQITPELMAAERPLPKVAIGTGGDITAFVQRVLAPLGGMKAFVKPGNRVVVKPNIGWDRRPEQAADTNPEVVKAVVSLALAAGAKEVLVFDNTCNEERRCYHQSGIKPVLEGMKNVRCDYIDKRKFVPVDISKGKSIHKWLFYRDALEADCYINVPVAKHHSLARLTIGLKNIMGVIGGYRGEIHQNIGQNLADLNTVIRPAVTIVDATRILLRNGPQGGSLRDVKVLNTILASPDVVAADAVATTLFGLKPAEIPATRAAAAMGLGEMNLARIQLIRV
ncbi:MAG: DUF362 domain-containing protein [Acidobacteria bacterium]|nr:DUF362 domain-containing protein [Acidobacteriota bacterium]